MAWVYAWNEQNFDIYFSNWFNSNAIQTGYITHDEIILT